MAPEVECIKVEKVYDFCCQEETLFSCFEVEDVCPGDVISECELIIESCKAIGCKPLAGRPGFAEVTFEKRIRVSVKVDECWKTSDELVIEKTVVLCVPADPSDPAKCDPRMRLQCETTGACENCVVTGGDTVCCTVILCECFESKAKVKIKVPSYGFCLPRRCELVPPPPPPCPPPFPPQCPPPQEITITIIDPIEAIPFGVSAGSEIQALQELIVREKVINGPQPGGPLADVEIFLCDRAGNCVLRARLTIQGDRTFEWIRTSWCRVVVTARRGRIRVRTISEKGHLQIKNGAAQAVVESDTFRCPNQPPFDP